MMVQFYFPQYLASNVPLDHGLRNTRYSLYLLSPNTSVISVYGPALNVILKVYGWSICGNALHVFKSRQIHFYSTFHNTLVIQIMMLMFNNMHLAEMYDNIASFCDDINNQLWFYKYYCFTRVYCICRYYWTYLYCMQLYIQNCPTIVTFCDKTKKSLDSLYIFLSIYNFIWVCKCE